MSEIVWSVEDIVFTMHSEQILSKYERLSEGVYRVATHDGQTFRLTLTPWEDDEGVSQ